MSKRIAGNQLTHDNWDDEDEPEEAGVFKRASDDQLKDRKIKVAKRRGVSFQGDEEGTGSGAFKGFKGFGGFGSNGGSSALAGFSSLRANPSSSVSNGTTSVAVTSTSKIPDFKFEPKKQDTMETQKSDSRDQSSEKSKYYTQLKVLNENVAAWIKKHVDSNPCCILTPIFKDYEKHLAGIEKLNKEAAMPTAAPRRIEEKMAESNVTSSGGFKPTSISSSTMESAPVFKFSVSSSDKEVKGFAATSSSDKKEPESSTKGFSFASSTSSSTTTSGMSGFQFGASSSALKPFSFAVGSTSTDSSAKPPESGATSTGGDEDYVPPKPEVKEIKEDALYSKRCKLFYQKETDGNKEWAEKGIGNLHLKETDNGKIQLLIRADTNLGNILLNILLNDSIPLSRQGKNNVNLLCIASPPVDPKADATKPVMMLLRVKTAEDADELYEKMSELKKGK